MEARGVTREDLLRALSVVNAGYENNVAFNRLDFDGDSRTNFTLRVYSSQEKGARHSGTGRRMVSACWHVHRDFLAALFELAPDARVRTALADYRGRASFEEQFKETGQRLVGLGVVLRDACECEI